MTAQRGDLPEPIPVRVLFGNADKKVPQISPNGKYYAYLADAENGVTNVFVKPIEFLAHTSDAVLIDAPPQQITDEQQRPIPFFMWARLVDSLRIFHLQDNAGDENYHLYCVDFEMDASHSAQDVQVRDLTPLENVKIIDVQTNKNYPDLVFVAMNMRDPRFFDMYCIDVCTGEIEMAIENPGNVVEWLMDDDFNVMGCKMTDLQDGSMMLCIRPSIDDEDPRFWRTIGVWPHGENVRLHDFNKDGTGIYLESSLNHGGGDAEDPNTTRLVLLSTENGEQLEVIAQDEKCDVDSVSFDVNARQPRYAVFNYSKPRVEIIDESLRSEIEHLQSLCAGAFSLISVSDNDMAWMYADTRDNSSLKYYIYDRLTGRHGLLFYSRPELAQYSLVQMRPQIIQTSDNEDMVIYVSLPLGIEAKRLPFVLNVHGGPWARDEWGYNPIHQLVANRGYGCLSVNFRGSTGFGKRWTNMGDKQWGGAMQRDLTDAVKWIIDQEYANPDKIAIFGASYGGYATLAGLAFTPELYACGIDIVGPSNLQTLFKSIPAYWAPLKKSLVLRIGDVENDPELNERISPLFHAHKMCRPLLIAQGLNDPRVKRSESDQIVRKLHENKQEVQYVVYKDEGHGFQRPQNRLEFIFRLEAFLAEHLGGRKTERDLTLIRGNAAVEVDPVTISVS